MHVISQQLLAYAYNIICMAHFSCSLKCCLMDSMHSLYMPSEIDAATDHASDDDDTIIYYKECHTLTRPAIFNAFALT